MRLIAAIALLVLLPSAFAGFSAPPVRNVSDFNLDLATSLDNSFQPALAQNGSVNFTIGSYVQQIPVNSSLDLAGISLLVDNSTYPVDGLAIIVSRGYLLGNLTSLPGNTPPFACDRNWFNQMTDETSWRCDFDNDSCAEYENSSSAVYDVNATFSFRNVSENVSMGSTVIQVPDSVLSAMADSSGNESLSVNLSGSVYFTYDINDRIYEGGSTCADNFTNFTASLPVNLSRNFTVSGTKKLFFLRSPLLREQWILSNSFDMIVLSQSPLYYDAVGFNGARVQETLLRNFSVSEGPYGLEQVWSNRTAAGNASERVGLTSPIPLEYGNSSFLYVYEINYSYPGAAPGDDNLSLSVNDSFMGNASFSDTLTSRYLSYNSSFSEKGTPLSSQPTRPSGSFASQPLNRVEVGLGLVALIMLLAFVNFWLT